jgi:hypothetical protein
MIRHTAVAGFLLLGACTAPGTTTLDTSGMVGKPDSQILAAFGTPAFVRKDGTAQIWRYDGGACKAFFFFQSNGTALSVSRVETLPRPSMGPIDSACLVSLNARVLPASAQKRS